MSIHCPNCKNSLDAQYFNTGSSFACQRCGSICGVEVFPAYFQQERAGVAGQDLIVEEECSCFFHPQKKAHLVCQKCGRFICTLCDIPIKDSHICPLCFRSGLEQGEFKDLDQERILYANIALFLAVLPLIIFYLTIFTAPLTLFIVFRYWKSPGSILGAGKFKFILAFILAGLQITGWIIGIYYLVNSFRI